MEQGDLGELKCVEQLQQSEKSITEEATAVSEEKEERTPSEDVSTCSSDRLLVLLFIALIEVVQVANICGFDAHQAGQTLHVFITKEQKAIKATYNSYTHLSLASLVLHHHCVTMSNS